MQVWEILEISSTMRSNLIRQIRAQEKIFSFSEESLLASLCCCLGLQYEIGRKDFDRLSPYLYLKADDHHVWNSELIKYQNKIGIRLWQDDIEEFTKIQPEIIPLLHSLSIDQNGKLSSLVVFPSDLAAKFRTIGFDLVIVRDWILNSALATDEKRRVNYQDTNTWEIEQNIASTQISLMLNHQLPFFGTHDFIDHLVNADRRKFNSSQKILEEASVLYAQIFSDKVQAKNISLVVSYLLAVILDDLAQPRWYLSKKHILLAEKTLDLLEDSLDFEGDLEHIFIPDAFHRLVNFLRSSEVDTSSDLDSYFTYFAFELSGQSKLQSA